jgi:hypothetical protein
MESGSSCDDAIPAVHAVAPVAVLVEKIVAETSRNGKW